MMKAKRVVRGFFRKALQIEDEDKRSTAIKHSLRSERADRLRAMIDLAKSESGMCVKPEDLDSDPWLFNCKNGTVDLRTGELHQHRREDYITKLAPVVFDPEARMPLWDEFLRHVTEGDEELAEYLQLEAGYGLTGLTTEEIVLLYVGGPNTGKTTLLEAKKATMGEYAATADFETFLRRNQPWGPRNDLARLAGARLVCASEVPPGRQFDEVTVKQLTGGDTVSARFLYGEYFEYKPQFKICLAANHRPSVRDDDPAIWRRLKAVPFENVVAEDKCDPSVKARLSDPSDGGPAILAWMVEGALKWQRDGLREPAVVRRATEAYRSEMATFSQFIEDRCVEGPEQWVASQELFSAYEGWSRSSGYRFHYGPQRFKEVLRGRGHVPQKRGGVRGWNGIGLAKAA
jgi:putative DNA primase/helicase